MFPIASLCTVLPPYFLSRSTTSDSALGKNMFMHRRSIYMRCDFVDGEGDDFRCKFQDITLPNKIK
jgi:hypothetical protein